MIATNSIENPWHIIFTEEPVMFAKPLGEFSKLQLETNKAWLEAELVKVNDMLTYFTE